MPIRDSLTGAFALLSILCSSAFGRLIEDWPYERLFQESDLVVIATAQKTANTEDTFQPPSWKTEFQGQETRFAVQSVLKGDVDPEKAIRVLHYRLPEGMLLQNGPLLVIFRTGPQLLRGTVNGVAFAAELPQPDYLLFLRKGANGRYEPVSGKVDPALSVKEIRSFENLLSPLDGNSGNGNTVSPARE